MPSKSVKSSSEAGFNYLRFFIRKRGRKPSSREFAANIRDEPRNDCIETLPTDYSLDRSYPKLTDTLYSKEINFLREDILNFQD
jgi:hypothetical protein